MNWKEVKEIIEKEIDKIWFDEPLELTCAKKGLFPGNAGTDGQAAGNFLFIWADSHSMGNLVFSPTMFHILDNPDFNLDHCKVIFQRMAQNKCKIAGMGLGKGSKCPAAWLNLPKFHKFVTMIIKAYDTIKTKEEFKDLLWSWFNYVDRMNKWTYTLMPMEVMGQMWPAKNEKTMTKAEQQLCVDAGLYDYEA